MIKVFAFKYIRVSLDGLFERSLQDMMSSGKGGFTSLVKKQRLGIHILFLWRALLCLDKFVIRCNPLEQEVKCSPVVANYIHVCP